MRKLFLCTVLGSILFMIAGVSAEVADNWQELEEIFKEADIIPDGKLDQGEFDIYHRDIFGWMDTNHDQRLDRKECTQNCTKYLLNAWHQDKQRQRYIDLEFSKTPYRFDAIDIDQSGDIVVYEYILFGRERFPYFDHDNNGFIENVEFCSAYRSSMPCDYTEKEIPK